jgi:hypothetical protein
MARIACKKTPMARTIFSLPRVVVDNPHCNISIYSYNNGENRYRIQAQEGKSMVIDLLEGFTS